MDTLKEIKEYKKKIKEYEAKIEELKLKIKFLEKNVEMGIIKNGINNVETFISVKKIADLIKKEND